MMVWLFNKLCSFYSQMGTSTLYLILAFMPLQHPYSFTFTPSM
jgi:hypothetical protein